MNGDSGCGPMEPTILYSRGPGVLKKGRCSRTPWRVWSTRGVPPRPCMLAERIGAGSAPLEKMTPTGEDRRESTCSPNIDCNLIGRRVGIPDREAPCATGNMGSFVSHGRL
jgi:hypothetical protein